MNLWMGSGKQQQIWNRTNSRNTPNVRFVKFFIRCSPAFQSTETKTPGVWQTPRVVYQDSDYCSERKARGNNFRYGMKLGDQAKIPRHRPHLRICCHQV